LSNDIRSQQRAWFAMRVEQYRAALIGRRLTWRQHAGLLFVLSVAVALFIAGNIESRANNADARQNLAAGIWLSQHGEFKLAAEAAPGYHRREPFMAFLIAGLDRARGVVGLERLAIECSDGANMQLDACRIGSNPYRMIHVAFLLIAGWSAFYLVLTLTGSLAFAYAAFLLSTLSSGLLAMSDRMMTEIPAAGLMTLAAALSVAAIRRRSFIIAICLGLVVGALVLTKVVFAFLWIFIAAVLLVAAAFAKPFDRRLAALALAFACAHGLIAGGWMLRNYVQSDDYHLVEARGYKVYSVRAAYNTMRADEFLVGFLYFTPALSERFLTAVGIDRRSFERFKSENPEGFRRLGQKSYAERVGVLEAEQAEDDPDDDVGAGEQAPRRESVTDQVSREAMLRMFSDPLAHARTSVLLAYGALFVERGWGFRSDPSNPRVADQWGIAWPRFGFRLGRLGDTLYNLASAFALFAVPVMVFVRRRDISGIFIVLPAVYSHGVYAAISHFIPRYAVPEIPLRAAALCILIYLVLERSQLGLRLSAFPSLLSRARQAR
jgi:hypothetical protein